MTQIFLKTQNEVISTEHAEKQTQINATAQRSKRDAQKTPDMQNETKCCRR